MQLGTSATQVFYHLLDLNEEEKQQALQQLKQDAPDVYRALTPLIEPHEHEPFTALFGFHAHHATEPPLDLSNQLIDKYQLTHELGRGGMGVVYAAYRADETFEQQLAIKFIQPSLTQVLGKKRCLTKRSYWLALTILVLPKCLMVGCIKIRFTL